MTVGSGNVESDANANTLALSQTGRYALFRSPASNVSTPAPVGVGLFRRDRETDTTILVSLNDSDAAMGTLDSVGISDDGQTILFEGRRDDFDGDISSAKSLFVRDVVAGTTELVGLTDDDARVIGDVDDGALSGYGTVVAFTSSGLNLPADNGKDHLYLRDLMADSTTLVSTVNGSLLNQASLRPQLDDDGDRVVFESQATNPELGSNGLRQIFLVEFGNDPVLISADDMGTPGNSISQYPAISGDGRYVAYHSTADNLVDGVTDGQPHLYLHDTQTGATVVASVDDGGAVVSATPEPPGISDDGRYLTFVTTAVIGDDVDGQADVYRYDRVSGTSERVSLRYDFGDPAISSLEGTLSGDGYVVGFLTPSLGMVEEQVEQYNEGYVVTFPAD